MRHVDCDHSGGVPGHLDDDAVSLFEMALCENFLSWTCHCLTSLHEQGMRGIARRYGNVVGDKEQCHTLTMVQLDEEMQQRIGCRQIQAIGGFVK
jgi:hypothetical protein